MHAATRHEDRNVLPRVIRSWPGGVTTMICRQYEQVIRSQELNQFRQPPINILQRLCLSVNVTTVSIQHIKIHKIRKHDGAIGRSADCNQRCIK